MKAEEPTVRCDRCEGIHDVENCRRCGGTGRISQRAFDHLRRLESLSLKANDLTNRWERVSPRDLADLLAELLVVLVEKEVE